MKWFSLKGIITEVRRIRWPEKKELASNSGKTLVFVLLFCAFFVLAQLLITAFLRLIGVGA